MDGETLLGREDEAWTAFVKSFEGLPEDRREVDGVVPGWSVKDLLWHCGYWADYVGDVLERISAGQPEPPDQDWDALNRMVAEDGKWLPLYVFFFNDTATTEIYTLSLHDALPISRRPTDTNSCSRAASTFSARAGSDRKSTRLNSSHPSISYAVFCLKKKKHK